MVAAIGFSSSLFVTIFACQSLFSLINSVSIVSNSHTAANMTSGLCSVSIEISYARGSVRKQSASFQSGGRLGLTCVCFE